MRKLLTIAIVSTALAALLVGCSDGTRNEEVLPNVATGGATITKAELIDALWNPDSAASQDVNCVLGSTFKITSQTPFSIAKNTNPTDYNMADVVITSAINISFDDATTDGRGPVCAEGILQYMVQASEETPIDIETAESLRARHSLEHMVSGTNSEYPGCTIRAHFDKAGRADCDGEDDDDEEDDDDGAADEGSDGEEPDDEGSDDSADDDDDDDDDGPIIVRPIPGVFGTLSLKAARVSDDGVPCGTEEIQSVKLVVDEYNCQLQGYEPRPLYE